MKVLVLEDFLQEVAARIIEPADIVTISAEATTRAAEHRLVSEQLCSRRLSLDELKTLNPDCILTKLPDPDLLPRIREELFSLFGRQIFVHHHDPVRLDDIYTMFEEVGRQLKKPEKGRELSHKVKAQIMDWSANFYDRMKNKRVTYISSVEPLMLGGRWIPDMIRVASGHPQAAIGKKEDILIRWEDVVKFNPDVIIVAPKDKPFLEGVKTFKYFEKLPMWEKIYAVKRGDVFFTDGQSYFNKPTPKIIESMGILISAMAGFESGYITPRDSSYKLRYLELHRHKF